MRNIFKLIVVHIRLQHIRIRWIQVVLVMQRTHFTSLSLQLSDGWSERASERASDNQFPTLRVFTG